jgi:peptidoglycan/xylan/chitin deacetylase (PgdA/CDA1 family)
MKMKKVTVPILMYHQVAPQPHPAYRKYTVTPRAFAAQMNWLALARYTPITLDRLVAGREGGAVLPRRPVVITFDDGYQDCIDYAVPILQKFSFTAIFCMIAGLAGQSTPWLKAERNIEFPLMDWATARRVYQAGFQIGSHAMTHPHLDALAPEDCRAELQTSRRLLEEHLDTEIRHLAYPFGAYDEKVRAAAAQAGYRTACSVKIGLSKSDDDLLALHRVPVTGQDRLSDFICRLATAWPLKETLRGKSEAAFRRIGQVIKK